MKHRSWNMTMIFASAWALCGFAGSLTGAEVAVFILAGQSNAVGFGSDANELPPALQSPQNDILFWFEEGPFNSVNDPGLRINSGDAFVALQFQTDPSTATFGGLVDGFGPEMTLGRNLADALGTQIAVVKFAINATSLAGEWNPDNPGALYDQLTVVIADAMSELTSLGHRGRIAGFFWMQGEWDARNATDAGNYQTNLTNFIQQVRSEYGLPNLPFLFWAAERQPLHVTLWHHPGQPGYGASGPGGRGGLCSSDGNDRHRRFSPDRR